MAALLLEESDGEAPVTLQVNESYARRLEHNKKREDLHRLQELQKRGLAESDSEEDDESEDEDGVLPERTEVKIFDTLSKIKNKDPSIYKGDVKFFEEDEVDDDDAAPKEAKKKPVYLKDVVAQNALEENSDEEDGKKTFKTYAEEQQELKDEFLKSFAEAAVVEDEDADSLFKVRKKSKEELDEEEASNKDVEISQKLEEYFGKDNDLDNNDKFLKDYLQNQGWIDKNRDKLPSYEDVVGEISEDEAELNKQDEYEAKFNFRFEEGAGDQVPGHARFMENSVRKLPDKRKEQRIKKQARISEAELARQEEVKRLKNVKKKEIMEKMAKIKTIAGMSNLENLGEDDLEEDFNPEEYDKKMQKVFGEEYYKEDDPNFRSDSEEDEKPDFDAEDEALGLPKGWESGQGFAAMHKQMEDSKKVEEEKELLKEEIEKKLEEYYKLDYEDVVGNMPTRFKYTQVKPNTYDLTAADVLGADDKELNQYVSLKALAPYRTEEWIPRHKHIKITKKERKRRALDQVPTLEDKNKKHKEEHVTNLEEQKAVQEDQVSNIENKNKKHKKQKRVQEDQASRQENETKKEDLHEDGTLNGAVNEDNSNAATQEESGKKKKRKRKKPGLNMSTSRLISYGKIDLPKKRKH